MSPGAGFRTTLRQQARRRVLRLIPAGLAIGAAMGFGWNLAPAPMPGWRLLAAQALVVAWVLLTQWALLQHAMTAWQGPPWGRTGATAHHLLLLLGLALGSAAAAWTLRCAASLDAPAPVFGAVVAAGFLLGGTLRFRQRQPADREMLNPRLMMDQIRLMRSLQELGNRPADAASFRSAVLTMLIDQPDNTAARLLAWQMALRETDLSDAEHHLGHLRRLEFPPDDLTEMEAITALAAGQAERAASALAQRVSQVQARPRRTHAGQRADFVVMLHFAHALVSSQRWREAASFLDGLAADYESAPFAGSLDRLIVNHLRWRAARALGDEASAQWIAGQCRLFREGDVRRAIAPLREPPGEGGEGTPDAIRWWPQAALAAVAWWEERRRGALAISP